MRADGSAILAVESDGAEEGTVVFFDGVALPTTASSAGWLTATVAPRLIARPGVDSVRLRNASGESNALEFEVTPPAPLDPFGGPAVEAPPLSGPSLAPCRWRRSCPPKRALGKALTCSRGALGPGADGAECCAGTVVVFGNVPLATTFGSDHLLTAIVPAELMQQPGRYPVYLKYDATDSNRLEFVVER